MEEYGISEISLNEEFTRNALPIRITSDGRVVAILLSVEQYNKLVSVYKGDRDVICGNASLVE